MTIQASELLLIEGEEYQLMNVPLMPDSVIQLIPKDSYVKSTACYRGYVATWEIKDDKLYLIKLSSSNYELTQKTPVHADWVNDQLIFGNGNYKLSSEYVHLYEFEYEVQITIENGLFVDINKVKNDSFNANPNTF